MVKRQFRVRLLDMITVVIARVITAPRFRYFPCVVLRGRGSSASVYLRRQVRFLVGHDVPGSLCFVQHRCLVRLVGCQRPHQGLRRSIFTEPFCVWASMPTSCDGLSGGHSVVPGRDTCSCIRLSVPTFVRLRQPRWFVRRCTSVPSMPTFALVIVHLFRYRLVS